MRISDWSSDVCSSDLSLEDRVRHRHGRHAFWHDLRPGGGASGRAVSGPHPLYVDVDPLSHRDRIFRRLPAVHQPVYRRRSEEHTSELQSLMRISSAAFSSKKKKKKI